MYRVIIIDDEPWAIVGVQKTFPWGKYGFEVVGTMNDAYEALEQAEILKPDLIITDIRMPEMSGLELIEQVKNRGIDCEFVILSGFGEFSYAQQALRSGVIDYIIKPVSAKSAEQLLARIKDTLDKKCDDSDYMIFEKLLSSPQSVQEVFASFNLSLPDRLTAAAVCGDCGTSNGVKIKYGQRDKSPLYLFIGKGEPELSEGAVCGIASVHMPVEISKAIREANLALHTAMFFNRPVYRYKKAKNNRDMSSLVRLMTQLSSAAGSGSDIGKKRQFFRELPSLFTAEDFDLRDVVHFVNHALVLSENEDIGLFSGTDHFLEEFQSFTAACNFLETLFCGGEEKQSAANESFVKLYEYVSEHFTEQLSLSELAGRYFINFSYASSLFKKETGKTFSEYVTELRMKLAKELLIKNELSISEIGIKCGYEDSYYFGRVFKKRYGAPPSAYRFSGRHKGGELQ